MALCLVVPGLPLGACQQGADRSEADRLFDEEVRPIFQEKCTNGCHVPGGYSDFLLLGEDYDDDRIVGVASGESKLNLVEPGSLEDSYLWHKLHNTHLSVGGSGDPMPPQPGPLAKESLQKIEEYILAL